MAVQAAQLTTTRSFVKDEHLSHWLLGKGALADATGEFDVTPVSAAIWQAPVPIIKLLLNHSSGVKSGQLLHFAVQRKCEDRLEVVELLVNLGCSINGIFFQNDERSWLEWGLGEAGTALFTAAELGRDEVVAYLLSKGANAVIISNKGRTPLQAAENKIFSESIRLLS